MKICGIDPGISGAIVYISENKISPYKMPFKNKVVDVAKLISMHKSEKPDIVIVEEQFILKWQGGKGNITILQNMGRILASIEFCNIEYEIVKAKDWQKEFFVSGDKKSHISKAIELGFNVPNKSNRKDSKPHDGMADAYLIALYGSKK